MDIVDRMDSVAKLESHPVHFVPAVHTVNLSARLRISLTRFYPLELNPNSGGETLRRIPPSRPRLLKCEREYQMVCDSSGPESGCRCDRVGGAFFYRAKVMELARNNPPRVRQSEQF